MKTAVIVLSFNTKELLKNCLDSIFTKKWRYKYDIYVVDNASTDGSFEMVEKEFPKVHLTKNKENVGFTKGNNQILNTIKADLYLLLNSDTEVIEDSLDNLVDFTKNNHYGITTCRLIYKDRKFQPNAGLLPDFLALFIWLSGFDDVIPLWVKLPSVHLKQESLKGTKEVGWVSGSVMMIKKEVIEKIGGLDEDIFMYGEDVELCFRAKKAGFKVGWTDSATIMHIGGGSTKDPAYKQWIGEFNGLIYIYKKNYGKVAAIYLKTVIIFCVILRMIAFFLIGRIKIAQTYGKILTNF